MDTTASSLVQIGGSTARPNGRLLADPTFAGAVMKSGSGSVRALGSGSRAVDELDGPRMASPGGEPPFVRCIGNCPVKPYSLLAIGSRGRA